MVMRSLGRNATDQDIQDILSKIDKDHNGTIEFSEFVDLMGRDPQSLTPGLPPGTGPWSGNGVGKSSGDPETDELRQAFNVFDKDGSGSININELKSVMESLGKWKEASDVVTTAYIPHFPELCLGSSDDHRRKPHR